MSAFQRSNKTKTLFSQIEAGRPAAARTKLGTIEGSQSVLKSQTDAQTKENADVQTQSDQVTTNTTKGVENVGMAPVFAQGATAAQNAQVVGNKVKPTFATSVGSGISKDPVGNLGVINNGQLPGNIKNAQSTNTTAVNGVVAANDRYNKPLDNYTAPVLSEQLNNIYNTESANLASAEKELTEGNLGLLAPESNFEIQQAQNAQVLADRDSNIGKLRNMYGAGYDSAKYGALDSNLLQGQFNDASGTSATALQDKEMAKRAGELTRESYANNVKKSEVKLSDAKNQSDEAITQLSTEVAKGKEALASMIAKYGPRGSETIPAMKKLADDIARKEKELKDNAPKIAATKEYNSRIDNTAKNLGIDKNTLLKMSSKTMGTPGNLDYLLNFYDDYLDPSKSKVVNSKRVFSVNSGELLNRIKALPAEVQKAILATPTGKTIIRQGEEDLRAREQEKKNKNPVQKLGESVANGTKRTGNFIEREGGALVKSIFG